MLPIRDQRTRTQVFRAMIGAIGAVLHYAACAIAITLGVFFLLSSIAWIVLGEALGGDEWSMYWFAVLGVLLVELIFRPPLRFVAGLGVLSLSVPLLLLVAILLAVYAPA